LAHTNKRLVETQGEMISKQQFFGLLQKHHRGATSQQEEDLLHRYYDLFELEPDILDTLPEQQKADIRARLEKKLFSRDTEPSNPTRRIKPFRWLPYAAAVVFALAVGIAIYQGANRPPAEESTLAQADIAP